jgi:flagellar motor switch protein FliG
MFARNSSEGETRVASVLREFDKDEMEEVMDDLEKAACAISRPCVPSCSPSRTSSASARRLSCACSTICRARSSRWRCANADSDIVEAVLGSLSARSRRMIEAELSMEADLGDDEIQRARKTISSTALDLAAAGQLELPSRDLAA